MWSSISSERQSATRRQLNGQIKNVKDAANLSHFTENGKFFKVVRDGNKIISRENVFRGKRREKSDSKTRQIVASVISSRTCIHKATFVRSFIARHITYAYMCLLHVLHRLFILEKQKERNLYITQLVPLSHTHPSHCVTREWNKKQIFLLAPLLASASSWPHVMPAFRS